MIREDWYKQKDETLKAYQAFCVYLHLGSKRSIDSAYKHIHGKGKASRNSRYFQYWSSQYRWVARAESFDLWVAEQAHRQTAALQAQIVTKAKQAALKTISKIDESLDDAQGISELTRALNSLTSAIHRLQQEEVFSEQKEIVVKFLD